MSLFRDNYIIVAHLPANTSHVLQQLDFGVLAPFNEELCCLLNRRVVASEHNKSNDSFKHLGATLCS